jgi:hypothetical protein
MDEVLGVAPHLAAGGAQGKENVICFLLGCQVLTAGMVRLRPAVGMRRGDRQQLLESLLGASDRAVKNGLSASLEPSLISGGQKFSATLVRSKCFT